MISGKLVSICPIWLKSVMKMEKSKWHINSLERDRNVIFLLCLKRERNALGKSLSPLTLNQEKVGSIDSKRHSIYKTDKWHPILEDSWQSKDKKLTSKNNKPKWQKLDLKWLDNVHQDYARNRVSSKHHSYTANDINRESPLDNLQNWVKSIIERDCYVDLQTEGIMQHSANRPVWSVKRYCYLAAIADRYLDQNKWPAFPTAQTLSQFNWKYRKLIPFKVITCPKIQYHIDINCCNC